MVVLVILFLLVCLWVLRYYLRGPICKLRHRLDDQIVVVTGCNSGIGLETVYQLAKRGARIVMACRDSVSCAETKAALLRRSVADGCEIEAKQLICESLDLSSTKSIDSFASRLLSREQHIHQLINNAGISTTTSSPPPTVVDTPGIHEVHMRVNHLGHFRLTQQLLPGLKAAADGRQAARIINVSSDSHYMSSLNVHDLNRPLWGTYYAHSKLANVIHARELSRRYANQGVVAVSLHPGLVVTGLYRQNTIVNLFIRHVLVHFVKTSWHGAQTTIQCAVDPHLVPGAYYRDCRPCGKPNRQVFDDQIGELLWLRSEQALL